MWSYGLYRSHRVALLRRLHAARCRALILYDFWEEVELREGSELRVRHEVGFIKTLRSRVALR